MPEYAPYKRLFPELTARVEAFVDLVLPHDQSVPSCLVAYTRDGALEDLLRARGAQVWSFDRTPLLPDPKRRPFLVAELAWLRNHPYAQQKWPAQFERLCCHAGLWRFLESDAHEALAALSHLVSPGGQLALTLESERAPLAPQLQQTSDDLLVVQQEVDTARVETRFVEGFLPHSSSGLNWGLEDWQLALEGAGFGDLRIDAFSEALVLLRARQKG